MTAHFEAGSVKISTSNLTVTLGETNVRMVCTVMEGLSFSLNSALQWRHEAYVAPGSSAKVTILSVNAAIEADSTRYEVDYGYTGDMSSFTLSIKEGKN